MIRLRNPLRGLFGSRASNPAIVIGESPLQYLVWPPGETEEIGPERGKAVRDGIALFTSPHGSYRYVLYKDGEAISALQVVSEDKTHAKIANVYTASAYRRTGAAKMLLDRARRDFTTVVHSKHLTTEGKAWRAGVGNNPGDVDACVLAAFRHARGPAAVRQTNLRTSLGKCGVNPDANALALAGRASSHLAERRWRLPEGQRWVRAGDLRGE